MSAPSNRGRRHKSAVKAGGGGRGREAILAKLVNHHGSADGRGIGVVVGCMYACVSRRGMREGYLPGRLVSAGWFEGYSAAATLCLCPIAVCERTMDGWMDGRLEGWTKRCDRRVGFPHPNFLL
jgi:hypothetical protein